MAEPGFEIRYDAEDHVLHMRIWGFWSLMTLAAYTTRLLIETARLRGETYDILSDSREFDVQGAAVSAGFERIAARGAKTQRGRTAIVVASQLNRIQAQRTTGGERTRIFLDIDEARGWLRAERAAAA